MGTVPIVNRPISASQAARYPQYLYPLSLETVERMCRQGMFKTAFKPGGRKRSQWYIMAVEILEHRAKNHWSQIQGR
jgi:hypothetical protein